jgi:rare lipoprotein A
MTRSARIALLALVLAAAGCAREVRRPEPPAGEIAPQDEPRAKHGNPPFYEVEGRRYVVLPSAVGYVERGTASWYGPDFHGGRTATGEIYDMHAMSGAHPTLPLPTWVRVTNLDNGRSIVVRLNDRGPFRKDRIVDLSRAAAVELDMIRAGTARVEVRSLAGSAAHETPKASAYYAQAGAFASRENAETLARKLRDAGIEGITVSEFEVDGRPLFRVRAGPVASLAEFDALIERLAAAGAESPRLAL